MNVSEIINQKLFKCDCDETVTSQSARGHIRRTGANITNEQAESIAHGKMLVAGVGIIGGIFLMKRHPLIGAIAILLGCGALFNVREDWKAGKKVILGCS